jgi:tetratricopeptide (TPR) repeat protein
VTTAITGQLLPAERARLSRPVTTDPVAYEEYLKAMRALNTSSDEASLRSALAHFDRATKRDSGFAAAFAGEAEAWGALADGYVSGLEAYGRARNAASRALVRDSSQVLATAVLAMTVLALDFDAREAERLARRALSQDDRNSSVHVALSLALRAMGRSDASIAEARRARQADSLAWFNDLWYGLLLIENRQLDSAAAWLPRFRGVLPSSDADQLEGLLLAAQGDLRSAESLVNWRDGGGANAGTYVRILLARGDTIGARATVDSMLAARARGYYNPLALARAYAALGEMDRGMEWLQRAFDERTMWLIDVRVDPELAPLRADPRYAALERQLKY